MTDNFFSGLEKMGLNVSGMDNLFEDTNSKKVEQKPSSAPIANEPKEADFLLDKTIRCPMCDKVFMTKNVKNARARRLGADADLRPRYAYIDTLKYEVDSCPFCGYSAMGRYFPGENLNSVHRKLLKEGVCAKLTKPLTEMPKLPETYTYDEALDLYRLALYNSMVKNAAASEKAYTCLKISWLLRGKVEELEANGADQSLIDETKAEEDKFYVQAYEGMTKAVSTEHPPICGMDTSTVDYLLAQMAFKLGRLSDASKLVSNLLVSQTVGSNIKNKARDLKNQIIEIIKKDAK